MMRKSLEAIRALFQAGPGELVNRHSDWFTLRDAALHVRPHTFPHPEIATAAMISPVGLRLAGSLGTSLLSLSISAPGGFAALETAWDVVREQAARAGSDEPDRTGRRVLNVMHVADTREQAIADCTYGMADFVDHFGAAGFVPLANAIEGSARSSTGFVERYAAAGSCRIGSTGRQLIAPQLSHEWAPAMRDQLFVRAGEAIENAMAEYAEYTADPNRASD